jgi:hypothetical protein
MNSQSRRKISGFRLLKLLLLLGMVSMVFALPPLRVQADSNEPTPVPTNTPTPLPSITPEPAQPTSEIVVNIPVVENTTAQEVSPLPPAEDQTASAPTSFIRSISGINQCLIGAIILGLVAITIMVLYNIVQRMRT